MTREEAIEILTHNWTRVDNPNYTYEELDGAFHMAIEALSVANLKEEFESAVPNCKKCAIKELWKEAEKEDLVAVVRCEDCVWSKEWNDNQIFCDRILMRLRENDFCSYGGRRK